MKIAFAMLAAFQFVFSLGAQPLGPLPSGPILNRAPDSSRWVVQVTYNDPQDAAKLRVAIAQKGVVSEIRLKTVVVSKNGPYVQEITEDEAGRKSEVWCAGAHHVASELGTGKLVWVAASAESPLFTDYTKIDFPGFQWLTRSLYVGIESENGRDAFVFRDEKTKHAARIDVATRLPVSLELPDEKRSYKFLPPPADLQAIPPPYLAELEKWDVAERKFQVHPPKP